MSKDYFNVEILIVEGGRSIWAKTRLVRKQSVFEDLFQA